MALQSYRELRVWQEAMDLVTEVYKLVQSLPKSEIFSLGDQLRRASVSIPCNIAEGFGRQHTREFVQFLAIAKGSLSELETQVLIAQRLEYTRDETAAALLARTESVGRMISALRTSLEKRASPEKRGN